MSKEDYKFNPGDYVVYPVHGVGQVVDITSAEIGGQNMDFLAINFRKEKLTLKIPVSNMEKTGLRGLTTTGAMAGAENVLKSKPKTQRTPWSKRAQAYSTKINSGDPMQLAEVLRDLYKHPAKGEQTYSEHQLYDQAMAKFAPEFAAVNKLDEDESIKQIESILYDKYTF